MNDFLKKAKTIIIIKWNSLILVAASIAYGYQIITNPVIFENYRVYQVISNVASPLLLGLVFILLGVAKLVGILTKNKCLKRYSIVVLAAMWSVFCVSFLFSALPNTIWIFSLSMTLLAIGIAVREVEA